MSEMTMLERVARALCVADGKRPDEAIPTGRVESVRLSANSTELREVMIKGWEKYEAEAKRFIAAYEVMRNVVSAVGEQKL